MSTSEPSGPATDLTTGTSEPHPTLAGNRLDPSVSADGKMASTGSGVGGTSESQIRQEGLEHIRSRVDSPSTTVEGGAQTQPLSFSNSAPPASNPGAEDSSAGIPSGAGGVSSARSVQSPVTESGVEDQKGQQTVMGTLLSYVGLGGGQTSSSTSGERGAEEHVGSGADAGLTSGSGSGSGTLTDRAAETVGGVAAATGITSAAAAAAGGDRTADRTVEADRGEPTTTAPTATEPTTTTSATEHDSQPPSTSNDPIKNTEATTSPPADKDVTTGNPPTDSADPTTSDTAVASTSDDSAKPSDESGESSADKDHAAKMKEGNKYNESAIPTAGGERLGVKHWGESKVVPDNPAPVESTGVSSADGQPTDQVRENTAKNAGAGAGSAVSGDGTVEKEKLVDKIKDKLHIGHHKK